MHLRSQSGPLWHRHLPLLVLISVLPFLPSSVAFAFDHSEWGSLLKSHVDHGRVDYKGFANDRGQLDFYLDRIAKIPIDLFAEYDRETRIALWINAYNASAIRLILDHYPIDSPNDIPNFLDEKVVHIAGMKYSLREVRENVFRKSFR